MQKRKLGSSDVWITPILLGTWQAGKRMWVGIEDNEIIKAIRASVDVGMTTIDTAEIYGNGYSEQMIGQALCGIPRDRYELASKVFSNHLRVEQVLSACEQSLQNLKTEYLDLYQIHWPAGSFKSDSVPIAETMQALNRLKEQGKIRAIGVSNFSLSQLQDARQYGQIDSIQPPYSLFWRKIDRELAPYCRAEGITILAYSPLAQGLLTGKFGPGHRFEEGDHRAENTLFEGENYQRALHALDQLRPIAGSYGCSLSQLALAWVIAQPQTCAIAGARNSDQVVSNAQAALLTLSTSDLEKMELISRIVTDHLDETPVMWSFAR
jgi:aryl-alcohol dehydrogenase-like predicted oxidoreductase